MTDISLTDLAPSRKQFLDDVVGGLQSEPKTLPCKYFYDERGSQLFDQICELDEYYLTRTELAIMHGSAGEIARVIGRECVLIEYGSGSSTKTRILLRHLGQPAAYVPVDISREHLAQTALELSKRFPELSVHPVCADFTKSFELPELDVSEKRKVVYFPGSTIGNFGPPEAKRLLSSIARLVAPDGGLLIGVDLKKPREILEAAYDDSEGVTREFNRNVLLRINDELGSDFSLDRFRHSARYNEREDRVEMHLVSLDDQTIRLNGCEFHFREGESIHTENSYKYSPERFAEIAESAGLTVEHIWFDDKRLFSVQYLKVA